MRGYPEAGSQWHVVVKIIEWLVKVLAYPDFSLRTPKRGARLYLREQNELEGSAIAAGDDHLFSLFGLIDEVTEVLFGFLKRDLRHGRFGPFRDDSEDVRNGPVVVSVRGVWT
jgi:hypothetical protein